MGSTLRRKKGRGIKPPAFAFPVGFWIAGTVIAAIVERWWFAAAWDETSLPASQFYFGDAPAYLRYAAALSAGEPFDNGIPFHPPGWPITLSLLFRVFGWSADAPPDPLVVKHVAAILSGASVGLAALLAYRLAGRGAMIVASLLGTFHFGHIVQAATPNSEPLYGFLMLATLLAALRQRLHPVVIGILAGCATLVRAEFGLSVCLLAVWFGLELGRPRHPARAAFFLLGAIVTLLPTTVLNWRSIDEFNRTRASSMPGPLPRFAPVTSYGAFNFANANHERADGGFNWDLPSLEPSDQEAAALLEQGGLDLSRPPVYRAYVDGYRMGAAWLAAHPADAVALFRRKLAITFGVFDYGYLLENVPVPIRGVRRPVDQLDLPTSWLTLVHAALAAGGLAIATTIPAARILWFPILTLLASSLLFFGYVRLGVAYAPILWVLQAMAIARLLRSVRLADPWPRRAELGAAALALALLLAERSVVQQPRDLSIDGLVDDDGRLVEDQRIEITRIR